MSAYLTLLTPMTDTESLLAALADLGYGPDKVEVHEAPAALVGYRGDERTQVAHVILRRRHVGGSSNDIGFLAGPTGYRAIVSDFDRPRFGQEWLTRLHARYAEHQAARQERLEALERQRVEEERRRLVEAQREAVRQRARALGYQVQETRVGETVRLVLVKRSY